MSLYDESQLCGQKCSQTQIRSIYKGSVMQVRWGRLLTDDVRPDVILKSRWDFSANSTEVKLCWWKSRSRCPVLLMSFYIWNHCVVENIEVIKIKYSFHPKKKKKRRFHFQIHGSKVSAQFSLYLNLQWYFCVPLLTVRTITPHRGPDVQALPYWAAAVAMIAHPFSIGNRFPVRECRPLFLCLCKW